MAHILVTGASGFIGGHVIHDLLNAGYMVRGFARSPRPPQLAGADWVQGDIRDLTAVQSALNGCETVIHLACAPLANSFRDPLTDFQVNAGGTANILEAMRGAGVVRIIYTSSGQIYGYPESLPLTEAAPARPVSPYAANKYAGEILCETYARAYGLRPVIFRIANAYGIPLDHRQQNSVESIFMRRIAAGEAPVIKGSPHEARDFIHVSEVAGAIRLGLESEISGEVFNLGRGVMTTLAELAALIADIYGKNLAPILENPDAQPMQHHHNVDKARRMLGFAAKIHLRDGLAEMREHLYP